MNVCRYVCMYVCMYVCVYVCMYVCVCMYVYIYICVCVYVCDLLYTLSIAQTMKHRMRKWVINELERTWFYPGICLEGLIKNRKNLRLDSGFSGRDLNPGPRIWSTITNHSAATFCPFFLQTIMKNSDLIRFSSSVSTCLHYFQLYSEMLSVLLVKVFVL
jgi:hypothetical protein